MANQGSKLVAVTGAWLRKMQRINQETDVSTSGPGFKLTFNTHDEPRETRSGDDSKDRKAPFYESDPQRLRGYYFAYQQTREMKHELLYTDIVALRSRELHGITTDAVDIDALKFRFDPVPYSIPAGLRTHAHAAIDMFKQLEKLKMTNGEWQNDRCLRITKMDRSGLIEGQSATYFDQVGTNLTLDWASGKLPSDGGLQFGGATLRNTMERPINGRLPDLQELDPGQLSGRRRDDVRSGPAAILRTRAVDLAAIPKRGFHCTSSGSFELSADASPGEVNLAGLEQGMVDEIGDETGLTRDQYRLFPVAFARELPRGGKPQLFFAAVCPVDRRERQRLASDAPHRSEFVIEESLPVESIADDYSQFRDDLFTYEGWACLQLTTDFVKANEPALRAIGRG